MSVKEQKGPSSSWNDSIVNVEKVRKKTLSVEKVHCTPRPHDAQRDDWLLTIVEKKFKSKNRIAFFCACLYHEVDNQTK
jgi:hypothetical protein